MANKQFLKKYGTIGIGFGIVAYILSLIYTKLLPMIGLNSALDLTPIKEGFKSQLESGISQDLSGKLLGYLSGIPINFAGLAYLVVAGIIVAIVGGFIVDMIPRKFFFVKTGTWRLVSIGVLGTLVSGFIVTFLNKEALAIPEWQVVVSMAGYFLVVAIVYGFLAKLKVGKKVFLEP